MKKFNILLIFGLFALLATSAAQPVYAGNPGVLWSCSKGTLTKPLILPISQLNADIAKFEGLLNAYDANGKQKTKEKVLGALDDLSCSLDEFNAVLSEVYPTLTEEEQLAVSEAYFAMALYLENLAIKTNSVFDREVVEIIIEEKSGIIWAANYGVGMMH